MMVNKNRDGNSASPDLARLRGARCVLTSEVEEGQRMAESLVKQMTGGDKLVARFNYGDFFEFTPAFKIWIAANHKPIIRGDDYAIWRRIRLVPFNVTVPEGERDSGLTEKLLKELPGILNWAIDGCLMWQREGLTPPQEVKAATEEYRTEMDALRQWIEECCILGSEKTAGSTELYQSYKKWAEANTNWKFSQNKFGRKMRDQGFMKERRPQIFYRGIGLLSTEYEEF